MLGKVPYPISKARAAHTRSGPSYMLGNLIRYARQPDSLYRATKFTASDSARAT